MKVLDLPRCPACGSSSFQRFKLGREHALRRCANCQTISALEYADPAEVYVDGYMFGEAGQFGLDVRHPTFQQYLKRVAAQRIAMIQRATGLRHASLLDVGSGTGEVLLAARERGWRTQGVEPERTAADMARGRGLEVAVARLQDAGLPERGYDVVSAFHVIEHLPDSRGFISTMARWARPGGFVVLEAPNWASLQRRRSGDGWIGLRPLEHLVHFTPETLRRTLSSAGVEPVVIRSPSYLGPPQNLQDALNDLARHGRYRRLLQRLSPERAVQGRPVRHPGRIGWAVLRATERLHDRAGVGGVVFAVARVG